MNMHTFSIDGERVSSTRVRAALASGDLHGAEKLLGRPYRMCGRVAHGDKRGRSIGFPTANIHLHRHATPVQGVYRRGVVRHRRPTLGRRCQCRHAPDRGRHAQSAGSAPVRFCRDIYGRYVHVDFLHKTAFRAALRVVRCIEAADPARCGTGAGIFQARLTAGIGQVGNLSELLEIAAAMIGS